MTVQSISSKGKMSVLKIKNTIQKRHSLIRVVYGCLLIIMSVVLVTVDPVELATNWFLEMREGSFLFKMWQDPTYDVTVEVWVYNYSNTREYLEGRRDTLKVQQIGPFLFKEHRTNTHMRVDNQSGQLHFRPRTRLEFLPGHSVAHYKDVAVTVPSIAILAISTLLADKFGFIPNAGAYYSMKALDSRLFRNMTVGEFLWGYNDSVVTIANSLLPGWIDFEQIGIMDRLYKDIDEEVQIELRDVNKRYSIREWGGAAGLREQGFTHINTSIPCNLVQGAYEGMMISPGVTKTQQIRVFRKQGCRIYPFTFQKEIYSDYGLNLYRFTMENSALNNTSPFACSCNRKCLPNGFVDISNCYYGFPIALSKPHFLDVDPLQASYFEGMHPNREQYTSKIDLEPTLGIPLSLESTMQVNIAIRTSPGNPITLPLDRKVLPLLWLKMSAKEAPADVINLLRLRFVYAPPLIMILEVSLIVTGLVFCSQGLYRWLKPKYLPVDKKDGRPENNIRRDLTRPELCSNGLLNKQSAADVLRQHAVIDVEDHKLKLDDDIIVLKLHNT